MLNQILLSMAGVITLAAGGGNDNRHGAQGDEFYVTIMQFNPAGFDPAKMSITMTISNPTTSKLEAKVKFSVSDIETSLDIDPKDTRTYNIPTDYLLQGADKHVAHLRVRTDKDSIVQVYMDYYDDTTNFRTAGSFTVLPRDSLTKEYIVATHCTTGNCVILVTSAEDSGGSDKTEVFLRINPQDGQAIYQGNTYSDGETIVQKGLDKGESMQVICPQCDLTGSSVKGKKDIAVLAGGEHTELLDDIHVDMVIEQMMPTETIGRKYVLGSNMDSSLQEIIKIVPLQKDKSFSYQGDCYDSPTDRTVFIFKRNSSEVIEILADHQTLVAQFMSGGGTAYPDVVMNMPTPVFQWATSYWVYTPPVDTAADAFASVYVSVISANGTAEHLEIEPSTGGRKINTIQASPYEVTALEFDTGLVRKLKCTHADCRPFSAFLVQNKHARSSSLTIRNKIPDFSSGGNDDEKEVKAACSKDPTQATTSQQNPTTSDMETTDSTTINDAPTSSEGSGTLPADVTTPADDVTTAISTESGSDASSTSHEGSTTDTTTFAEDQSSDGTSITPIYSQTTDAASTSTLPSHEGSTADTTTFVEDQSSDGTLVTTPNNPQTTDAASTSTQPSHEGSTADATTFVEDQSSDGTLVTTPNNPQTTGAASTSTQPSHEGSTADTTTFMEDQSSDGTLVTTSNNPQTTDAANTSTQPSPGEGAKPSCCTCVMKTVNNTLSPEQITVLDKKNKAEINAKLMLNKKTLSSYIRTKESAQDERKSSEAIGRGLGIAIFSTVFGAICGSDLVSLIIYTAKFKRRFLWWRRKRQQDQVVRIEMSAQDGEGSEQNNEDTSPGPDDEKEDDDNVDENVDVDDKNDVDENDADADDVGAGDDGIEDMTEARTDPRERLVNVPSSSKS